MKQTKLTRAARGKECQVQIFPYCNGDPDTTVFAHAPSDRKGMSIKSPNWWGSYCCSSCHDVLDGRKKVDIPRHEIDRCFMRGIYRTMEDRINEGLIEINE